MCVRLVEMKEAMADFAATFDADLFSCDDARAIVKEAAAIQHVAATIKALAAVRAAQAKDHKAGGHRTAEEHLAHTTGTSLSEARETLNLGRRLVHQPDVADAARRGELSPTQASAIADAVAANPTASSELLDAARSGGSLAELKDRCSQIKADASDRETLRRNIHKRRRLRAWTDQQGEWHIHGTGNPEDGAQIMAAITPRAEQRFEEARRSGEHEHPDAYRFDALVDLSTEATTADDSNSPVESEHREADVSETGMRPARQARRGAPVKLIVRVDLTTLIRGCPVEGETCELIGYGPIAVSTLHDLLRRGDAFITAVLTKAKALAGVVHLGRAPNAYQLTALEWLYPTCAAQGCAATSAHLQSDHRVDWARCHLTVLDWLDRLCSHHHSLKTRDNWALVDGTGKRPFVPPTDPRHPNHPPNGPPP
jgi:hypothetical protein